MASAGSKTANVAGPATRANPKPVADWSVAPAKVASATSVISYGSIIYTTGWANSSSRSPPTL